MAKTSSARIQGIQKLPQSPRSLADNATRKKVSTKENGATHCGAAFCIYPDSRFWRCAKGTMAKLTPKFTTGYNYFMTPFKEKIFAIPPLKGISAKTIEEHLKLYSGYVNHTNLVIKKISELSENAEENMGILSGLNRRLQFEFNGMRNHEYYFAHLEGEPIQLVEGSPLKSEIEKEWGSFDKWLIYFKSLATTRGIGWAMLSYDKQTGSLLTHWVDEQHLGQLSSTKPILVLDMWEHSFVADYFPSGKKQYVEDFFANLNWQTVETNYANALL